MMPSFQVTRTEKEPDAALIRDAKRGDRQAFDQLVRLYQKRVSCVAQRITKSREDAEDVMQESFHKAFVHLSRFEGRARFSTWLVRIAINEAFMLLRRRRAVCDREFADSDVNLRVTADSMVDHQPNPEVSCLRTERARAVKEGIDRLSPAVRTTLLLRDIEEYSIEETAQILGTSMAAVKSRVFQGRRKLRTILDSHLLPTRQIRRPAS
jgi:RNA polymerase sigma-70 factor, ECF subfamily